jgi:hypothetical protein
MDKSTIVSIFPYEVNDTKGTLQPGEFHIDKGSYDKPALLVVGSSSWWKELDLEQPLLEIPVGSVLVANSIITDYINGMSGVNIGEAQPGLFYIPGERNVEQIKKEFKGQLDLAAARQKNWYTIIVKIADTLWARTNGNPLAISDHARMAAQELGLKEKPWMKDFSTLELKNCPACGVLRNDNFPVCQHCKVVIDKKKFDELGLKFAS